MTDRAAVYSRISRDPDETALGVQRQERAARELAERRGWEVVEVFRDNDVSAATPLFDRSAGARLREALAAGTVKHVVAFAMDRLSRDRTSTFDLLDSVEAAGGVVATVADGVVDPTSESGQLVGGVQALVAWYERRRISRRLREKQDELAANGLWHGGATPLGYRPVPVAGGYSLEKVPEQAEAIRDAVGRILDGESFRSVAERWNRAGLVTPFGRAWTGRGVLHVLSNPGIAGLREHRGQEVGRAAWDGIVDRRTFKRLQAELDRRREENGPRTASRGYLLTGLLFGECGHPLVGHPIRGKRTYTCAAPGDHDGVRVRVTALPVEQYVVAQARERQVPRTDVRDPDTVPRELREALDRVEHRLTDLAARLGRGDLDPEDHAVAAREARTERDDLDRRIAELTTPRRPWEELADLAENPPDLTPEEEAAGEEEYRRALDDHLRWGGHLVDVRGDLEVKVARVTVRSTGRRTVPVADRAEIAWRAAG